MSLDIMGRATRLFSLPDVYFKLREVLDDPNSSMQEVARVVSCDPGLTARLLKLVNSPQFRTSRSIDTVSRAIGMLGTNQVHDLALATVVADRFAKVSTDVVDMHQFWRRSVYCALAARGIAVDCDVLDSERLFVAGLLRDIGHLVMYDLLPSDTQQAHQQAAETNRPLWQVERDILGFDYTQVAESLMRHWKLPDNLRTTAALQNDPASAGEYALSTSIVHIAAAMTEACGGSEDLAPEALKVDLAAWQICRMEPGRCPSIHEQSLSGIDEMLSLFTTERARVA